MFDFIVLFIASVEFYGCYNCQFYMRFRDYLPYYKRNLNVAGTIVLSQVGVALTQLVDTFMVSRLGTVELAAVSFASSVALLGFLFVNGLLMGVTPIVGQTYTSNELGGE